MFLRRVIAISVALLPISANPVFADEPKGTSEAATLEKVDSLTRQGAFSSARDQLKALLAKYPHDPQVHLTAGRFFRTIGSSASAVEEYKRAIELGATSSEPFLALSQMYLANLDNQQALDYAKSALSKDPGSKQAELVFISALLNEGRLKEAQQQLSKVMGGSAASDADLMHLAFRLNRERGQLAYAKQFLDDAIKLKPSQTDWLLDRAELYQSLGDYGAAKHELENFLTKEPRSIEGMNKLGVILEFYFHDFDAAKRQYEKILARDPDYVAAITGLDRCKAKKNDVAGQMKLEFWKTLNQLKEGLAPTRSLR